MPPAEPCTRCISVLGPDGDARSGGLSIDHDGEVVEQGEIGVAHLQQMFVPDPGVAMAFDRGAAVIVIAADPRRITHKYGSRGWRYALMECGAVMHHIMLTAAARDEITRPIGSYFDLPLQQAVCDPAAALADHPGNGPAVSGWLASRAIVAAAPRACDDRRPFDTDRHPARTQLSR